MNKPLRLASTITIGLIVFAITIAVFFLGSAAPKTPLDWNSLLFVLISEAALFGALTYLSVSASGSNKQIVRMGILSTLSIYWAISVLLALFRYLFAEKLNTFVIVNIILTGLAAVICILLNGVAARVHSVDSKTSNARLFLQDIEKSLFALKSNENHMEFQPALKALFEKVHYSDTVGSSSYDASLSEEVNNLEMALDGNSDDKKELVEKAISQIQFFISQRNMELSQGKRGGF